MLLSAASSILKQQSILSSNLPKQSSASFDFIISTSPPDFLETSRMASLPSFVEFGIAKEYSEMFSSCILSSTSSFVAPPSYKSLPSLTRTAIFLEAAPSFAESVSILSSPSKSLVACSFGFTAASFSSAFSLVSVPSRTTFISLPKVITVIFSSSERLSIRFIIFSFILSSIFAETEVETSSR